MGCCYINCDSILCVTPYTREHRSTSRMAARTSFVVAIVAIIALTYTSVARAAQCDCDCYFKLCQKFPGPYNCSDPRTFCQKCGSEDCMCLHKDCKKHAQATGQKDRCDEGLPICKSFDTTQCKQELDTCLKIEGPHGNIFKCVAAWYKCVTCFGAYKDCQAHSPEPEKCPIGLYQCRLCQTEKCTAKKVACLRSEKDGPKCVKDWYTCLISGCP